MIVPTPRLLLRPLTPADADGPYRQWMSDPLVLQHLEARLAEGPLDLRGYVEAQTADPAVRFHAITLRETGEHIGNIKIGPVERWHRRGDVGIIIGARSQWGKGLATEAIRAFSDAVFAADDLVKITAGAYATNVGSIRAFERAGFHVEATRRRHYRTDEGWVDGVLMARFAPEAGA